MKAVLTLIAVALVLGVALGGSFIAGTVFGKSQQDEEAPEPPLPTPTMAVTAEGPPGGYAAGPDPQALAQLQERIASGEISPQEAAQLAQSLVPPGGLALQAGSQGLTGTIEKIEDGVVTLSTPQGPVAASVGPETVISITSEGTIADLEQGMTVTVNGQPGEGGGIQATGIFVQPGATGGPGAGQ
jgi:hypothetical protein